MSSSSEKPRLPAEDRAETRQLTVAALAADCAEFAESDEEFLNREHSLSSVDVRWVTKNGTGWSIGFNALHCYEDESYTGQAYLLDLSVKNEASHVSAELRQMADEVGLPLPDDENVRSIVITYAASYIVSQYVTLGWTSRRDYEIMHDQEGIMAPGIELDESYSDDEENGDDMADAQPKYMINIRRIIEHHDPPEISPEKELGDSYVDKDTELMDSLDVEVNLSRANEIFRILQDGRVDNFDLSTIFPPEAMTMLGQSGA